MISTFWHTLFFDPIYNGLVFLIDVVPRGDVGIAIIVLTVVVKVALLPLSIKAARTQRAMRAIEPKLAELKERYKDDREALARETFAIYKHAKVNPFASIALLFIQIPVVIALYLSVYTRNGIHLPAINTAILYSFISAPHTTSMLFLDLVNIATKNIFLAALAGATQFFQVYLTFPKPAARKEGDKPSLKDDFAQSMHLQMRYVMPLLIFFFAYSASATVALYFIVSNIMGIVQEYLVRSLHKKSEQNDHHSSSIEGAV